MNIKEWIASLFPVVSVSPTHFGAYGEVLMAEYNIAKSDLLSDEEILQIVKDIVIGKYKLP
jgi:hypothetical protein